MTRARVTDSPGGDCLAGRPDLPTFRESTDQDVVSAASGGSSAGLTIRPAFDGLRGVAVLGVLAAHLGEFLAPGLTPWPLKGGFLGVDLFFVLSGFLITGLLLKQLQRSRRIRLKRFYLRRVSRLVPALLGLLAAHWVYTAIQGYSLGPEREATLYALTFTSNWQATLGVHPAIDVPLDLSHLWSLGVEGQFYLVWPLLLLGLYRWVGAGRRLIAVLGAAIVGVALLRALEFHSFGEWARVYTRVDTRADSLLVGALLAVVCARGLLPARNLRLWLAAAGGAGLAIALVLATPDAAFLYWGGLTAVAVAGAAILSVTLDRAGRLTHALSWSPIRSVGLASYSIYLWHLPVYLWAVRVVPGGGVARITVALSVTALTSTVSYLLLERPYMRRRGRLVSPSYVVAKPAVARA